MVVNYVLKMSELKLYDLKFWGDVGHQPPSQICENVSVASLEVEFKSKMLLFEERTSLCNCLHYNSLVGGVSEGCDAVSNPSRTY